MKGQIAISNATIDRLPLYYRTLRETEREGLGIISSDELGRRLAITPEQIRKDLASFGQFGKKGVGYYVEELKNNIGDILGLHNHWNFAVIGVGHLGVALANYQNFIALGFNLAALIDNDPAIIGETINGIVVEDIKDIDAVVKREKIQIGIVTVPADKAQGVIDALSVAGVKGIWNFAPANLKVGEGVCMINADLSVGLSSLSYHLTRRLT